MSRVTAKFLNSGSATAGQVPKADGSGNVTYQGDLRIINAQTGTTYIFVLSDGSGYGGDPLTTFGSSSATTVTVPSNANVAFPVGTQIDCLQLGSGTVTFAPDTGVTLNSNGGLDIAAQFVAISLLKVDTDSWVIIGNLA